MKKILILGCGHMGSSLLKAWLSKTNNIYFIVDPIQYKNINKKFKGKAEAFKNIEDVKNLKLIDIIIFAVKPQILNDVLKSFAKLKLRKETVFISIVAGKKIKLFNKHLQVKNQFIRVMPNMPALINQGMTCLLANNNVTNNNKKIVNSLFLHIGKTLWLKNEIEINKVTAISGSGPGYIFLFIDAFEKAALKLGLGEKITKNLVKQTLLGSVNLFSEMDKKASILANEIAVKGGTTEAALNEFKNNKILHQTFVKAIRSAYKKANELGK